MNARLSQCYFFFSFHSNINAFKRVWEDAGNAQGIN